MAIYTFKKEPDGTNGYEICTIEYTADITTLEEMIEVFEDFVKGCGFVINGRIDVIEEEN